jgi:hypothetical protein
MRRPPADRRGARAALLVLTALLLGAAAPRPAGAREDPAPGAGGALRITADPPRLLLGSDGGAELRIQAPPEVEELSIFPNVGKVEGVRRLPGGGFAARYRPPPERYPQVALVGALARTAKGLLDGWLAIPLSGQGEARVHTTPGAEITLRVGERSFGPRRADAQGLAVIPVVVPPGVREAHHGFQPVDLKVPETPLVHAIADHAQVHAHETQHVRVFAYVVAPHGAARRGDVPTFEASRGSVAVAAREPGAFEALWTLPPGPVGEDRLAIRLPGAAASRTVLRLDAVRGPPATVAVAFDREALQAGESAVVTARVTDAAGNAVDEPLELSVEGGELSRAEPGGPGAVTARLSSGRRHGAIEEAVVTARSGRAGLTGTRAIKLLPGPPAAARFSPREAVYHADGVAEQALALVVLDRFENPVRKAPVVTARWGEVLGVEADGKGAWRVRYRAPAVPERMAERLTAQAGSARAEADLLLLPPGGVSLLPTGGVMFEVRGRFVAPRVGLALEIPAFPLGGALTTAWRLEAEGFGYAVERAWSDEAGSKTVQRRGDEDVLGGALLLGLAAQRPLGRGAELLASLSGGAVLSRSSPPDRGDRTGWAPALRGGLGVGWPLRRATPFLEASLLAAGPAGAGAFAAAALSAGVRFDISEVPWRRSSSSTTSP